jgi:perosamine synthetase
MDSDLALFGGTPVREKFLPYGRHFIDEKDIKAVTDVLRSDYLTTGPANNKFEAAFSNYTGARFSVAVSSGTAALHAAVAAAGVQTGDEVIVPAITFAATANCVLYMDAQPVFADVDPDTLLIDPEQIKEKLSPRTKAIISVDLAGQPCDYEAVSPIADSAGCMVIADACHAIGATRNRLRVGTLAELNTFSFHPVKHMTTGEGGMITTNNHQLAHLMRRFRNHGINRDYRQRNLEATWYYEIDRLGNNYRLNELQAALGTSQLQKLNFWIGKRRTIASRYDRAFEGNGLIKPLRRETGVEHAYHLYIVRLERERLRVGQDEIFRAMRAEGIGVNVHYIPVYLHPFYRQRFGTGPGLCPEAESAYEEIMTLPIFPGMGSDDVNDVINATNKVLEAYAIQS